MGSGGAQVGCGKVLGVLPQAALPLAHPLLYSAFLHFLPFLSFSPPFLQGLAYLHDQGVVHRDIKASSGLCLLLSRVYSRHIPLLCCLLVPPDEPPRMFVLCWLNNGCGARWRAVLHMPCWACCAEHVVPHPAPHAALPAGRQHPDHQGWPGQAGGLWGGGQGGRARWLARAFFLSWDEGFEKWGLQAACLCSLPAGAFFPCLGRHAGQGCAEGMAAGRPCLCRLSVRRREHWEFRAAADTAWRRGVCAAAA